MTEELISDVTGLPIVISSIITGMTNKVHIDRMTLLRLPKTLTDENKSLLQQYVSDLKMVIRVYENVGDYSYNGYVIRNGCLDDDDEDSVPYSELYDDLYKKIMDLVRYNIMRDKPYSIKISFINKYSDTVHYFEKELSLRYFKPTRKCLCGSLCWFLEMITCYRPCGFASDKRDRVMTNDDEWNIELEELCNIYNS